MQARHAQPLYALWAGGLRPYSSPLDTPSRTGLFLVGLVEILFVFIKLPFFDEWSEKFADALILFVCSSRFDFA
jgi:hypothetical protein